MAVNKPTGDNARKGAVKKRTQRKTVLMGRTTYTKRSTASGRFIDQKEAPAKKKFKGVRMEK
jgi:dihydrofolate reductase